MLNDDTTKLLSALSCRKAYLIAMRNYQPLTEYNTMNASEAINAIWYDPNSILYFKDYSKNMTDVRDAKDLYLASVYNYLNADKMEIRDYLAPFEIHEYLDIPKYDGKVHQRDSNEIVKELEVKETSLNHGNPSITLTLPSSTTQVRPCYIPPSYKLESGTITLGGEFKITDTKSPMSQIELDTSKDGVQAKAKATLSNALGSLSIEHATPKDIVPKIIFKAKLGEYDIITNPPETRPGGLIGITGTISKTNNLINENIEGSKIEGTINLDFDLNFRIVGEGEFAINYKTVGSTVLTVAAVGAMTAGIIYLGIPVLVGGAVIEAGTAVVAGASGLASLLSLQKLSTS